MSRSSRRGRAGRIPPSLVPACIRALGSRDSRAVREIDPVCTRGSSARGRDGGDRDVVCSELLLVVDVAETGWNMEVEDKLSEVRLYHRTSAGGFRLRTCADLSLFTARFCELSIARVLGVQNRSFLLRPWPAVRWGSLACAVSSGWRPRCLNLVTDEADLWRRAGRILKTMLGLDIRSGGERASRFVNTVGNDEYPDRITQEAAMELQRGNPVYSPSDGQPG